MLFLKCVVYLCLIGAAGFLAGRILPKTWIDPTGLLFRCSVWEKGGKIYEKLGIRKWHNRLPDMSRIFPNWMPPKNLSGDYKNRLPEMIRETCVAELVHAVVGLLGLYCVKIWKGIGGMTVALVHLLMFNLPYILIQRYHRPRLLRLQAALDRQRIQREGVPG